MQRAPLQTYASALVFSPRESQIRKENWAHYPRWFKIGPVIGDHWSSVLQALQGHEYAVAAVAFSSDGKYLASLSWEYEVLLWDAMSCTLHSTLLESIQHRDNTGTSQLPLSTDYCSCITFSPNGQLGSVSSACEVQVWEPATGSTCRKVLDDGHGEVTAIAFASDSTLVISYMGNDDHEHEGASVQTWIHKTGALLTSIKTKSMVCALSFSTAGNLALACSDLSTNEIILYNTEAHALRCVPTTDFYLASFSSDDQLALAEYNSTPHRLIRIYDLSTGSYQIWNWDGDCITALAFSMSNRDLFIGCDDGSVHRLDLESRTGTCIWTCSNNIVSICPSPDGRLAIASNCTHEIRILEVESGSTSTNGDLAKSWAFNKRKKLRSRLKRLPPRSPSLPLPIISMTFSRDGRRFAYASGDDVHVVDSATRPELGLLRLFRLFRNRYITAMTISGSYLASSSSNPTVQVWGIASGKLQKTLDVDSADNNPQAVRAVAFSPKDRVLVSVDYKGIAKFWDTKTWSLKHTLTILGENQETLSNTEGKPVKPESTAFSQSGKCVVFLSENVISIWDAEQYICLQTFEVEFPPHDTVALAYYTLKNQITFFADDSYIDTTLGRVNLNQLPSISPNSPHQKWLKAEDPRWKVYDNWLFRDGKKMLWLPPDFRPTCIARYNDLLVLGHESGKITFFDGITGDSTHEPPPPHEVTTSGKRSSRSIVREFLHHRWRRGAGTHRA